MEVTNLLKHLICDKLVVRFHINSKIVILMVLIREKKTVDKTMLIVRPNHSLKGKGEKSFLN